MFFRFREAVSGAAYVNEIRGTLLMRAYLDLNALNETFESQPQR